MKLDNLKGGYAFLRGIAPYSAGVMSLSGYEIEHARFVAPLALDQGFRRLRAHLERIGRPPQALCGMELRSPNPFSFQGFNDFNKTYTGVLDSWGILLDGGLNPVARTNVAPEIGAPPVPSLYGFSYTVKSALKAPTFIIAGGGELPEGSLDPKDVVRTGETSAEALREKARFVMGLMTGRLRGFGLDWSTVTATDIYTIHPIHDFLADEVIRLMGGGAAHGVTWHYSRPPIVSIEYEMDARGCRREVVL
jgi:hypothetical protein